MRGRCHRRLPMERKTLLFADREEDADRALLGFPIGHGVVRAKRGVLCSRMLIRFDRTGNNEPNSFTIDLYHIRLMRTPGPKRLMRARGPGTRASDDFTFRNRFYWWPRLLPIRELNHCLKAFVLTLTISKFRKKNYMILVSIL